jgi:hypothetical protein
MIEYIRRHLGVKLFLSYLFVILVGVIVIALATSITLPEAFNRHMGPGLGSGQAMMRGSGTGSGMMPDLFTSFKASFNEAMLLALLAAGLVAVLVSLLLSRGGVAPVKTLTVASQRIADGHYAERV